MSTVGVSVANTEFDAAQALLDLQSNSHGVKHEKDEAKQSDGKESIETAKLFLSCFIASNVPHQPKKPTSAPKVGTVSPMYAVNKTNKPARTEKMKSPTQESPRDYSVNSYHTEEGSKRSKIFKRTPIKHFTVTSGPWPDIPANKTHNSTNRNNFSQQVVKVKTCDVGTQTDEQYQLPIIETMELTISKLCEKIKSLEAQIKSNKLTDSIDRDISDNGDECDDFEDNGDDDESYKANSNDMSPDDSNGFDSDDWYTEDDTPRKKTPKQKVGQHREFKFNNSPKVLSNRNVNLNTDDMVSIGQGNATIPSRIYRHINWNSYTSATRKLLTAVFSRRILATHSLTGKPSPAFPNKPAKKKLDPALVNDIVQTVVERCSVPENVVRTSITTKCADESKMFRTRQQNKKKRKHKVKENIPPNSDSDQYSY